MPDISTASIYEALGVTPPGEGGNEQAAAEPAAQGTQSEEGGNEQGVAAPASESGGKPTAEEGNAGPEKAGAGSTEGTEPATGSLSEDERRENAAKRRREEQQQAINEALEQERERSKGEWASFFAKANLKNTLTGQPITTREEFNSWHEAYSAKKLERDLKAGKLTQEGLNAAISENPTIKKLQENMEREAETAKRNSAAEARARIDAELKEIHELDPSINTTADLLKMPNAKEFYEYVRKGNSFVDAFYLVNRKKMAEQTAEAAKQQAMNAARSKDHLNATGNSRGAGGSSIPAEEMEIYKLLNPDATNEEIQAYHNKRRKEK